MNMVGFDPDLVIRHEIDRVLAARGIEPDVVMEFDNIETIKRAIEIDAGVSLLPEPTVVREVAAGTLATARIADEELVRPLGLIHARGKPLSATVRRFIELLRGHARDTEADVAEATNSGAAAHA
jgi:DNA-binding transcriptional LysR family regulator